MTNVLIRGQSKSYRNAFYRNLLAIPQYRLDVKRIDKVNGDPKRFRHQRRMKKVLFFLFREGPVLTWRKTCSRLLARKIAKKNVFLIAKLKDTRLYVYGKQYSLSQNIFYFSMYCVFDSPLDGDKTEKIKFYDPFTESRSPLEGNFSNIPPAFPFRSIHYARPTGNRKCDGPDLYLIGCGDYVRTQVMPVFKHCSPKFACDFNPLILNLNTIQRFEYRTNDFSEIGKIVDERRSSIAIIASYHSFHTRQALQLLALPNFHIMLEKPPCVSREDLESLVLSFDANRLAIGYNRRHIRWNEEIKQLINIYNEPVSISVEITEAQITHLHWYFLDNQGTRVTGNLCHWLDLCTYWLDTLPNTLVVARNEKLGIDYSTFSISFSDGSMAQFFPNDWGDGTKGVRERIRLVAESFEVVIEDYVKMTVWERGRTKVRRKLRRNKGHREMYERFLYCMDKGQPHGYGLRDLVLSTELYIQFCELFNSGFASRKFEIEQWKAFLEDKT